VYEVDYGFENWIGVAFATSAEYKCSTNFVMDSFLNNAREDSAININHCFKKIKPTITYILSFTVTCLLQVLKSISDTQN